MVKVRKGNVVMTIKESEVSRYIDLGYDVIDNNGNILQKSIPNDIVALKTAYKQHLEEIKALTEEIRVLKEETQKKTTKAKKSDKAQEEE